MWIVTVLSPLEYTGASARLMDGTRTGLTPLPYQYSGRHISNWKLSIVVTVKLAPGVTGKIQVGEEPGDSAQVSVPAYAVPLAVGTPPNAPVVEATDPLGAALLQAARPVATATAHAASAAARRYPPARRGGAALRWARVPGSVVGAWAAYGRIIWLPSVKPCRATAPGARRMAWLRRWREFIEQPYKV